MQKSISCRQEIITMTSLVSPQNRFVMALNILNLIVCEYSSAAPHRTEKKDPEEVGVVQSICVMLV